jgi:hypothetical protein
MEVGRLAREGKGSGGQMKIQQMAFMIVAVFFFFILVGLFFLNVSFKGIKLSAAELQKEQAISSLGVLSDMPELGCGSRESFCLDRDKLRVLSGGLGNFYEGLWPVASVEVNIIYPGSGNIVKCPAANCNSFKIYDNGQRNQKKYSTFVSICERVREKGVAYDRCEIGKLIVGVKINED